MNPNLFTSGGSAATPPNGMGTGTNLVFLDACHDLLCQLYQLWVHLIRPPKHGRRLAPLRTCDRLSDTSPPTRTAPTARPRSFA